MGRHRHRARPSPRPPCDEEGEQQAGTHRPRMTLNRRPVSIAPSAIAARRVQRTRRISEAGAGRPSFTGYPRGYKRIDGDLAGTRTLNPRVKSPSITAFHAVHRCSLTPALAEFPVLFSMDSPYPFSLVHWRCGHIVVKIFAIPPRTFGEFVSVPAVDTLLNSSDDTLTVESSCTSWSSRTRSRRSSTSSDHFVP